LTGKYFKKTLLSLSLIFLLGCQTPDVNKPKGTNKFQSLTAVEEEMSQDVSNELKKMIGDHERVTNVFAANTFNKLVVGFEVRQRDRFRLKKLKKQFSKKIEKMYPMLETVVTTDKKLIWELKKIEEKINNESATVNEIQRDMKKIIKLSKDEA